MATTYMDVRYIGKKERKQDTVNGTDTVWNGFGDVQRIPENEGRILVENHPDVWQDVEKHPEPPVQENESPGGPTPPTPTPRPMPMNEAAIAVIIEPDGEDPQAFELVLGAMNEAIQEMGYVVTAMSNDGQNVAPVEIQSVHLDDDGNIDEIITYETIDSLANSKDEIEAWGKKYLEVDVDKRYGPKKLKEALKAVLDLRERCIQKGEQATKEMIDTTMVNAMEDVK